jgi:hypothetical protein
MSSNSVPSVHCLAPAFKVYLLYTVSYLQVTLYLLYTISYLHVFHDERVDLNINFSKQPHRPTTPIPRSLFSLPSVQLISHHA